MDFAEEKRSLLLDPPRVARPQASSQPAPERIETRATYAHERNETRTTHAHEQSPRETRVQQAPSIATPQPFPPSLASAVSQLSAPRQTVPAPAAYVAELGASAFLPAQHSGRTEEFSQPVATNPAASSASPRSGLRLAQFMPIATHLELQPAASNAEKTIPQLAPRQKATQASTSEEVQIHIGRIEVIAVPPPGAAAPPTSRSRSTSLDDYLRRRKGGAG
jgi:hypothetical protein